MKTSMFCFDVINQFQESLLDKTLRVNGYVDLVTKQYKEIRLFRGLTGNKYRVNSYRLFVDIEKKTYYICYFFKKTPYISINVSTIYYPKHKIDNSMCSSTCDDIGVFRKLIKANRVQRSYY